MSIRIIWRSTVFFLTLILIYLAFPILIVPSSLPAIKAIFTEQNYPDQPLKALSSPNQKLEANAQIYEINIETVNTPKQKLDALKKIHRQGINLILARN